MFLGQVQRSSLELLEIGVCFFLSLNTTHNGRTRRLTRCGLFFFIPLFFAVFLPPLRFSSTLVPPGVTGIKLSFVRQTHKLAVGARILPAVREQASEVVRLIFVHIQKCLAPQGRQRRLQKQGCAGKGALKKRLSSFGLVGREPAGISQASSL